MGLLNVISSCCATLAIIGTYCVILHHDRSKMPDRVSNSGKLSEGTVVEIRRNPGSIFGSEEGEGYAPVVDTEAPWGKHRHFSTDFRQPSPYQIGQKVIVRYYHYRSIREVLIDGEVPRRHHNC